MTRIRSLAVKGLILAVFVGAPWGMSQETPSGKTAEQAFPNIEILKGMPAERGGTIMNMFDRVLGVECTHCHVDGAYEKDDKPTFAKARRMFQMRNWIAQTPKVNSTCWTCHRGHPIPQAGPASDAAK